MNQDDITSSPRTAKEALIHLFKVLNQDPVKGERDKYLSQEYPILAKFPYVNGDLFKEEDIEIPPLTEDIINIILHDCCGFDWSKISPTIFGAVFESTLNPETRRKGGMHYTSVQNIHKVIDPLFLDELKAELAEIKKSAQNRLTRLEEFQNKLANLKFLDPACGSGNFLTETYICIRRLENEAIKEIQDARGTKSKQGSAGQIQFGEVDSPVKVSITQFYGIEINDFAVSVARAALWIAEAQMLKETEDIIYSGLSFLPLTTNASIVEGNALRINWEEVLPASECSYIMGNPPFVGYGLQSSAQKQEVRDIYVDKNGKSYKKAGKIDYVSCWFYKASKFIEHSDIQVAFVSTNSITQGEQVSYIWEPLFNLFNISINFAYTTFRWDSEATLKAHVHCVIIGFSYTSYNSKKFISTRGKKFFTDRISPYLLPSDPVFIKSCTKPICKAKKMSTGNRPADGGHLIIEANEYDEFVNKEPRSKNYIKNLTGATEYINNTKRYCLWLVGASPAELKNMPLVLNRIQLCKEDRLNGAADRQKLADTPYLFRETINPDKFIIVPRVSSGNRRYIPIGFLDSNYIPTDAATIIVDAALFDFGVLISNVHMAWMRAVAGRLEMRYRYSKDIVYNNFPWPGASKEKLEVPVEELIPNDSKEKIEETAQAILDARAQYPDSSLADLYDPLTMPPELLRAHQANDRAVMQAYGLDVKNTSEADCVAHLMKMYQQLTS